MDVAGVFERAAAARSTPVGPPVLFPLPVIMYEMPRYAAVDIGSNSVRLLVGDYVPGGQLRVLASEREVTRLGEGVFRNGRITDDSMNFLCAQLARMSQIITRHDVLAIRAVATAAVRDANNQQDFMVRASTALGWPIEVISGQEEARLIHLGVITRWPQPPGRILLVDVGGGSGEVMLSEGGRLREAFSKPLGAVRLTEVFLQEETAPTPEDLHRMERYIDEKLKSALETIGRGKFERMIATSASAAAIVCAVNRVPRTRRDQADRLRASKAQVRKFYLDVASKTLAQRRQMTGIGPRRAEIIVPGAALFWRVLELFQHHSMYYLAAGVRDGIIADLAARGVGRELSQLSREQRAVVERTTRRYAVPMKHARKVADLAHQIYTTMHDQHRLPPAWGKVLEAAAYLHDSGHYISDTSHHKHSEYIVRNADLPGFTDHERILIALLCRYHRKAMPQQRHVEFQALSPEERRVLQLLIPLLRLADSLDRANQQHVESIAIEDHITALVAKIKTRGDSDLDEWAAERLTGVFQQVYGKPLEVIRTRA